MDLPESVARVSNYLSTNPGLSQDEIMQGILDAGIDESIGYACVIWVPIAFARVVLRDSGARLPEHYLYGSLDSEHVETRLLKEQPVFQAAMIYAAATVGREYGGDELMALACRSPEFDAINKALHDGSQIEDLRLSGPVVFRDDTYRRAVAETSQPWWKMW